MTTGLRRRRGSDASLLQEDEHSLVDDKQEEITWLESALAAMTAAKRSELAVEALGPDEFKAITQPYDPPLSVSTIPVKKERRPLGDRTSAIQNAQRGGDAQPSGKALKKTAAVVMSSESHLDRNGASSAAAKPNLSPPTLEVQLALIALDRRTRDGWMLCVQVHQYLEQGQAVLRTGDFAAAADCFSAAITLQPLCEIGYHKRACCYFRQRRFENAVIDFNHAIRLANETKSSTLHRLHHDLGQAYVKMRDFDQASESFRMAEQELLAALEGAPSSESDPRARRLRKELAQVKLAQEHCTAGQSMNECSSEMKQNGANTSFFILKALAQSYSLKGDKQKARECFVAAECRRAEFEQQAELQKNSLSRKLSQIGKFLGLSADSAPNCEYAQLDVS